MARQSPSDLLRDAAALVSQAISLLDTTSTPCHHCGTTIYRNVPESLTRARLAETPRKLIDAAARIEDHPTDSTKGSHCVNHRFKTRETA